VKKGDLDALVDLFPKVTGLFEKNPVAFGAAIIFILFFVLFLVGSSSEGP
jgi:hypothetical protein